MTRTLTYNDSVQVTKATLDSVRDIGHGWHDPPNGQVFVYLREQASIDSDGEHVTDDSGNPLYEVSLAAELRGIADADISTEVQNLVDAINGAFPEEWPDVDTGEVSVK